MFPSYNKLFEIFHKNAFIDVFNDHTFHEQSVEKAIMMNAFYYSYKFHHSNKIIIKYIIVNL